MSSTTDPNTPTKENPYPSELLVNRLMTEGSNKETRHFELSLRDSGLQYEPGDSLGVLATNCEEVVADLLNSVGLSGEETVEIGEESIRLKDALKNRLACTVLSKIQINKNKNCCASTSATFMDVWNFINETLLSIMRIGQWSQAPKR